MANKVERAQAQEIFRQLAWNLAGTLQGAKSRQRPALRPLGKR